MPELPEVETIRRGLEPHALGKRIERVLVGDTKILQVTKSLLVRKLPGQTIRRLSRRGKFLILELDRDYLIFHFGMTGQMTFRRSDREDTPRFKRHSVTGLEQATQHAPDRHTHLQIFFEAGGALFLRDVRKFGKVFLLKKNKDTLSGFFGRLGIEPFTPDYTLQAFLDRCRNRKLRLKSFLLDQSFVAGIGNIYADEALFEAGIHPARTVRSLRRFEKERLFEAVPRVLERGIDYGGTSFRDYVNSNGDPGSHQEELKVYGRCGEACLRCGSAIRRMVISQRGTHYCPTCQPRRYRRGAGS